MSNINFLKPDKSNLSLFLLLGLSLVFISIFDVFLSSFFKINTTGFLPTSISFLIGGVSLSFEIPVLKKLAKTSYIYEGGVGIPPELISLTLALSLYTATFIAECVRAGVQGVSKGQKEAAASIGLNPNQILKLVVMPQALRIIIPPTTNQYLNLTKNSSLAAAIAYPDIVLVFAGTALMQTGRAIEIVTITMLTYLTLSISISILMNWYNKKVALTER